MGIWDNWTKGDYFAFVSAVAGLGSFFVGVVAALVTASLHPSPKKSVIYKVAVHAIVVGLIACISGVSYLVYTAEETKKQEESNANIARVKPLPTSTTTPSPEPSPDSTPLPRSSPFEILTMDDHQLRYEQCLVGNFKGHYAVRQESIEVLLSEGELYLCRDSSLSPTGRAILSVNVGVGNYRDIEEQGAAAIIFAQNVEVRHSMKPMGRFTIRTHEFSVPRGRLADLSGCGIVIQINVEHDDGTEDSIYFYTNSDIFD